MYHFTNVGEVKPVLWEKTTKNKKSSTYRVLLSLGLISFWKSKEKYGLLFSEKCRHFPNSGCDFGTAGMRGLSPSRQVKGGS